MSRSEEAGGAPPDLDSPDRPSIGTYLARQRRLRGISLDELAQLTRIPVRSLERLEAGSYDGVTDGFARGFVRTVAGSLGLEPADTLARMLREPSPQDEVGSQPSLLFRRLVLLSSGLIVLVLAIGVVRALTTGGRGAPPEPVEQVFRRDAVRLLAESERAAGHRAEALDVLALSAPGAEDELPQAAWPAALPDASALDAAID